MSHAIYVRDLYNNRGTTPRLLAYAVGSRQTAQRVVNGIVRSYTNCGQDPISQVHWFRDGRGLHELWVTPT